MQLRSLGYQTDVALLQLGGTTVEDRRDHLVVRSPHNLSHWWGNFLLLDQVPSHDSSASWLNKFAAAFPEAEHVALGFDATDGTIDELDWFTAAGFIAEAQVVMTAQDVHEPAHRHSDAVYRALQSVETDPDYRRQGLAGSLVHHVSRYGFDALGARALVMVADPDYFAIDLYRAVGFAATETQLQVERRPVLNRT